MGRGKLSGAHPSRFLHPVSQKTERLGRAMYQSVAAKNESGVRVGQRLLLLVATAEIFCHDLETKKMLNPFKSF